MPSFSRLLRLLPTLLPTLLLTLTAAQWLHIPTAAATTTTKNTAPTKLRVAVLEFTNTSSDKGLQSLGKGLQSMLTTDLSKVAAITLIERARLQAILTEQHLGTTGKLDPATAARIGKLAGATHLLAGSYTIHGQKMRLDARLFNVSDGKVLLAEQITGERDAFFELEKSLVRKLIKTFGVELRPKERAGIARIHTADFDAFKRFSQGVAYFDSKRYSKALDALRAAMKIDSDFRLARVTLDQYQQIVAQIRARATTLTLTKRELARLAADKVALNDSQVAQRLVAIAAEKGTNRRLRRLAALTYLVGFYDPYGRNHGRISRFQDRFEPLVVRGRVETLARRYLAESRQIFPAAPLFVSGRHPPDSPAEVEKRVTALAAAMGRGLTHSAANGNRALIKNLGKVRHFLRLIAADGGEIIAAYTLALKSMQQLNADAYSQADLLNQLADRYLSMGDVGAASGALTRRSALLTNPSQLKRVATRIEALGELARLLKRTDKKPQLRAFISARGGRLNKREQDLFKPGAPSRRLLRQLARIRQPSRWWSYRDPYWLFGALPAQLIQGARQVVTGPRINGLRSGSLRYYRSTQRSADKDVLIALGRNPVSKVELTFRLNYQQNSDYWPLNVDRKVTSTADLVLEPGRPDVTLLFGLHNIDTRSVRDPVTRKSAYPRPTLSLGVRFRGDGAVELVHLGQDVPAPKLRQRQMKVRVLARKAGVITKQQGAKRRKPVRVRIRVGGGFVRVQVGRKKLRWALPKGASGIDDGVTGDGATGFIGLHIRGVGFCEVRELRLKR